MKKRSQTTGVRVQGSEFRIFTARNTKKDDAAIFVISAIFCGESLFAGIGMLATKRHKKLKKCQKQPKNHHFWLKFAKKSKIWPKKCIFCHSGAKALTESRTSFAPVSSRAGTGQEI